MNRELEELSSQLVQSWADGMLNGDVKKAVHDALNLAWPILIDRMADAEVRHLLTARVKEAAKQWAQEVAIPKPPVPTIVREELTAAFERLQPFDISRGIAKNQITAYRLWKSGESVDLIADRLGLTPATVKKLLKRTVAKVDALREQLSEFDLATTT